MTPENPLKELIEKYDIIKTKYQLPKFSDLNRLFDIEDIDSETEFLLRRIRKNITSKISEYNRFIEMILNPSNAPMFFFKVLKKLNQEDKEILSEIYEKLGKSEIKTLSLEIDHNEEKEAEFIKEIYNEFTKEIKGKFLLVIEKLNNGEESVSKTNGSYFG